MPLKVPAFGVVHIPAGDGSRDSAGPALEHDHQQTSRVRRSERGVVTAPSPPEERSHRKYFLRLLRVDAMPQGEVQDIPVVPLEVSDAHGHRSNTLHYPTGALQLPVLVDLRRWRRPSGGALSIHGVAGLSQPEQYNPF
jgi:hypothetical protein